MASGSRSSSHGTISAAIFGANVVVRSETTHGELRAVGLETFEDERTDHLHKAGMHSHRMSLEAG